MQSNYVIVTVPYLISDEVRNLAANSYKTFPASVYKIAVTTHVRNAADAELLDLYNNEIIESKENCLGAAWNIGVRRAFELGHKYVLIPNLDVEFKDWTAENIISSFDKGETVGIATGWAINDYIIYMRTHQDIADTYRPLDIDLQGFSCFAISKECYEAVGAFSEAFKPAYFEDSDYIYRLKNSKFGGVMNYNAPFMHHVQGTLKYGDIDNSVSYNSYIKRNAEIYIKLHGGLPGNETR